MNNSKLIGLHIGYLNKRKIKTNIGISINYIINKISFIKCTYEINDINNYIQIINNADEYNINEINEEIESKIRILNKGKKEKIIFNKIFKTKGINHIVCENLLTNMSFMFKNCSSLKELNLSSFKTDNVRDMRFMFYNCSSLEELYLSSFKTDNVTNMSSMFENINSSCHLICKDNKLKKKFEESTSSCMIF